MNIWWARRDLRLEDNQALNAALHEGSGVLPVYILDDCLLAKPAEKRHGFLLAGLRALDEDLRRLGSRLIIRRGDPLVELPRRRMWGPNGICRSRCFAVRPAPR